MNLTHSFSLASAAVQDPSSLPAAAKIVVQNAATLVADAVGKGGFQAKATLGQLIEFQLTGLLVVFTVLGGLTLMCVLLAWILKTIAPDQYYGRKLAAAVAPAAAPSLQADLPASIHPGLTDPELVAILAVAATKGVGQPVSLVKFRHMGSMDWTWSIQGRVSQHGSHQP